MTDSMIDYAERLFKLEQLKHERDAAINELELIRALTRADLSSANMVGDVDIDEIYNNRSERRDKVITRRDELNTQISKLLED